MTYFLKETDEKLIKRIHDLSNYRLEPKGFKTQIIMFAGERLEVIKEKDIPSQVQICSINEKDITIDDLKLLLANTENARNTIDYLISLFGNMRLKELYDRLIIQDEKDPNYIKGLGNTKWGIIRNLAKWLKSPLFDTKKYPPINFKKILGDIKTITSFSTYLQEDEDTKALIYGLILKKIFFAKRNKIIENIVNVYIREISNLAGRNKISHNYTLSEKYILRILREGRDYGAYLFCDTQRANDLLPIMRRQFGIHIAMRQDLKEVKEYLLELQEIDDITLSKIPHLGRGEAIICTGIEYFYPILFPPTLHHHKRERENIWELLKENGNNP